jgi:hypothetical protein
VNGKVYLRLCITPTGKSRNTATNSSSITQYFEWASLVENSPYALNGHWVMVDDESTLPQHFSRLCRMYEALKYHEVGCSLEKCIESLSSSVLYVIQPQAPARPSKAVKSKD